MSTNPHDSDSMVGKILSIVHDSNGNSGVKVTDAGGVYIGQGLHAVRFGVGDRQSLLLYRLEPHTFTSDRLMRSEQVTIPIAEAQQYLPEGMSLVQVPYFERLPEVFCTEAL